MAYVPVPKDLKKVRTKVAFNLTKRQLIGFSVAALVGFPVYLLARKVAPNDVAVLCMIVATLPIFFVTMYEKDGLPFEKYFKYIYLHKHYQPEKRVRKEVYLEQKKKTRNKTTKKQKRIKGNQKGSKTK